MENLVGKICPFCRAEIKEGDDIKVCPTCNIPHHMECWKENKGCTTFGCEEQYYEEQYAKPADADADSEDSFADGDAPTTNTDGTNGDLQLYNCANCGNVLQEGQASCPKCGTPKVEEKKNVCGKCGAELLDGQEFCPKCGQKAGLVVSAGVNSAIEQFNSNLTHAKKKKRLLPVAILAGIVVILAIVVGAFFLRQPKVEKIELSKSNLDMYVGDSATLTYTLTYAIEPKDGNDIEVSWKSTNTDVAKVSSSGNVTAVGKGTCTITVTADGETDEVTVTVQALKSQEQAILGYWYFDGGLDAEGEWISSYDLGCEIVLFEDKTGCFYIGNDKREFTWSYLYTSDDANYIYEVSFNGGMVYDLGEKTLYAGVGDYFLAFK